MEYYYWNQFTNRDVVNLHFFGRLQPDKVWNIYALQHYGQDLKQAWKDWKIQPVCPKSLKTTAKVRWIYQYGILDRNASQILRSH